MTSLLEQHRQAMEIAERAFVAKKEAAEFVQARLEAEPTRSVLYRSAGTLAFEGGDLHEAERVLAIGLSGNPPREIAEELRQLSERVLFAQHLELRGA